MPPAKAFQFALLLSICLCAKVQAQTLHGVIEATQGLVQIRQDADQPWLLAKPGIAITEGAEFRTGPRSAVQFRILPDQVIILDRLGSMKVVQAVREANGLIKTDIGMNYGRTRYRIEQAGLDHESTVRTPSAVLGIRGSEMDMWEEFESGARSQQHTATFTPFNRNPIMFGEGMAVDDEQSDPGTLREYQDLVTPHHYDLRHGERRILARRPDGALPNGPAGPLGLHELHDLHDIDGGGDINYRTRFTMTWESTMTGVNADNLNLFTYDSVSGQYVSGTATDLALVQGAGYPAPNTGSPNPVSQSTNGGRIVSLGDGVNSRVEVIEYRQFMTANGTLGAQIVGLNSVNGTDNFVSIKVEEFVDGQLINAPPTVDFNLTSFSGGGGFTGDTGPSVPPNHPFNEPN